MIRFSNISVDIQDPQDFKLLGVFRQMEIKNEFNSNNFDFIIPDHLTENKHKKDYKAGFLNELYSYMNQDKLKKEVFEFVTKRFDVFVDERQYQNMIKEYTKNKYLIFIKN
jgi:hypothetical protein